MSSAKVQDAILNLPNPYRENINGRNINDQIIDGRNTILSKANETPMPIGEGMSMFRDDGLNDNYETPTPKVQGMSLFRDWMIELNDNYEVSFNTTTNLWLPKLLIPSQQQPWLLLL